MTRTLAVFVCFAMFAVGAFAHGNEKHVVGTVTKVTQDTVTVQTAAKTAVDVMVMKDTKITKGSESATLNDLHVGDRVVIHAMVMQGGKLMAHTVQIGVAKR